MQKVSLPRGDHVFPRIKILQTPFEKGQPRNNPVKLFQNLTSCFRRDEFWRISREVHTVNPPPPPHTHTHTVATFFNIFATIFEKGHTRNNPMKLFQNRISSFKRRFLKNSLKNSIWLLWQLRVFDGIKFCKQFSKRTKEHSCQVWFKLAQWFRRKWCWKKLLTTHDGQWMTHTGWS